MKVKRVPLRMCLGCGEMKPKKELLRIVKTPEGDILLDKTGKKAGRGAYVCHNIECVKKARKSRRLEKNFSQQISAEVYDGIEREMENSE